MREQHAARLDDMVGNIFQQLALHVGQPLDERSAALPSRARELEAALRVRPDGAVRQERGKRILRGLNAEKRVPGKSVEPDPRYPLDADENAMLISRHALPVTAESGRELVIGPEKVREEKCVGRLSGRSRLHGI